MGATLRYDVGRELSEGLHAHDWSLLENLGAKPAARWAGHRASLWECHTFALKLPRDVEYAWRLLHALRAVNDNPGSSAVARKGGTVLAGKLWVSLGLEPRSRYLTNQPDDTGWALLTAISHEPADCRTWAAYADRLQEEECEGERRRGRLIAGWLGKKAVTVRYGVAFLAEEGDGGLDRGYYAAKKQYELFDWGWAAVILKGAHVNGDK